MKILRAIDFVQLFGGLLPPPADNTAWDMEDEFRKLMRAHRLTGEFSEWVPFIMAAHAAQQHSLRVVEIKPAACVAVHSTDLLHLPAHPPRLLTSGVDGYSAALVLDVPNPGRGDRLWDDTYGLAAWFIPEGAEDKAGAYVIHGLRLVGGEESLQIGRWSPHWGVDRLLGLGVDRAKIKASSETAEANMQANMQWSIQAVRFLVMLGLLLDAEKTPLATREEASKPTKGDEGRGCPAAGWRTKYVYLDAAAAKAAASRHPGSGASMTGLQVDLPVRGHLRRQHYGPGNQQEKWIYVEGYSARKWISPRPTRTVVGVRLQ